MKATYTNAIHLQGIGLCHALPAGVLQPGNTTLWNNGHPTSVVTVENTSEKMVTVTLRLENGLPWVRKFLKTRLVAVTKETWVAHGRDPAETANMDLAKIARSIYGKAGVRASTDFS